MLAQTNSICQIREATTWDAKQSPIKKVLIKGDNKRISRI